MSTCDADVLFSNAETKIKGPSFYAAINIGDPHGIDTFSDVYAITKDPLKVPRCVMCLVKFLDGSPVAVRYRRNDVYRKALLPLGRFEYEC